MEKTYQMIVGPSCLQAEDLLKNTISNTYNAKVEECGHADPYKMLYDSEYATVLETIDYLKSVDHKKIYDTDWVVEQLHVILENCEKAKSSNTAVDTGNELEDAYYRFVMADRCDGLRSMIDRLAHTYTIEDITTEEAVSECLAERIIEGTIADRGLGWADVSQVDLLAERRLLKHVIWKAADQGHDKDVDYMIEILDKVLADPEKDGSTEKYEEIFSHERIGKFHEKDRHLFCDCRIARSVRYRLAQCVKE